MRTKISSLIFLVVISCLFSACGPGDSPEEQVRLYVKAGEDAAEARNVGAIKTLISEKYSDAHRRSRREIIAIAARYFLSNKNIHIFTRIGELTFPEPDKAELLLYVAMTGQNVSDLDALLNMQADLYRFDMHLVRENKKWQLISAEWRPASPNDFF